MKKNKKDNEVQNPYSIDKLAKIKPGVKLGFLKFWIGGVIFYIVFMSRIISSDLSTEFVLSVLILTLFTEYLYTKILSMMRRGKYPLDQYYPFGNIERKKLLSLFASFIYSIVAVVGTAGLYLGLNTLLTAIGLPTTGWFLALNGDSGAADPITIGFMYLLFDYLWVSVRRVIIYYKGKKSKSETDNAYAAQDKKE